MTDAGDAKASAAVEKKATAGAESSATAAAATPSASPFPTGMVCLFAGNREIPGWLRCDGRDVSVAEYPALYAVISDAFDPAKSKPGEDAKKTFRLPDLREAMRSGAAAELVESAALGAFDRFAADFVAPFVEHCAKVDRFKAMGRCAQVMFDSARGVVYAAANCKPPRDSRGLEDLCLGIFSFDDYMEFMSTGDAHKQAFAIGLWTVRSALFDWKPAVEIEADIAKACARLRDINMDAKRTEDDTAFANRLRQLFTGWQEWLSAHCKKGLEFEGKKRDVSAFDPRQRPTGIGFSLLRHHIKT